MIYETLWNNEEPVTDLGIDVPDWIEQDITPNQVAAICQGGCDSGAYMPAVTYRDALETMAEHGGDVFDYLEESGYFTYPNLFSWCGFACHFLSSAVDLWASGVADEIETKLEEEEEDRNGP